MNSLEALTKLSNMASPYYWRSKEQIELISIVEQDLNRLKKLEEENQDLKNRLANEQLAFDKLFESNQKLSELYVKLKQKLEEIKSFSYSMPPYYYDVIKEMIGNE